MSTRSIGIVDSMALATELKQKDAFTIIKSNCMI